MGVPPVGGGDMVKSTSLREITPEGVDVEAEKTRVVRVGIQPSGDWASHSPRITDHPLECRNGGLIPKSCSYWTGIYKGKGQF
jgi:hypothetical protein